MTSRPGVLEKTCFSGSDSEVFLESFTSLGNLEPYGFDRWFGLLVRLTEPMEAHEKIKTDFRVHRKERGE